MIETSKLVLVTGGSGFIGTNLVSRLIELGFRVVNLDCKEPVNESHKQFHRLVDLKDLSMLQECIDELRPEYIVHLAARTDLKGTELGNYLDNTLAVENMCIVASNCNCLEKILFASSMLVCRSGHIPASSDEYCPDTVYGLSKVKGEEIVRSYRAVLPPHLIIRFTSIWGPWFGEPYRKFFDILLAKKYFMLGKRSSTKTFGYVGNSVNQVISLLTSTAFADGEMLYLGDEPPLNIDEWAESIAKISGMACPRRLPYWVFYLGGLIGDVLRLFGIATPISSFRVRNMTTDNIVPDLNTSKINAFQQVTLEQGIQETLKWIGQQR